MLTHALFFYGHREAVLALAQADNEYSFFSSGAEGLIVKWDLRVPNDGRVITKFSGYIASMAYNKSSDLLFTAINYVGVYVINGDSGKVVAQIDLPYIAFKSVQIEHNLLIVISQKGELLLFDMFTYELKIQLSTGLNYNSLAAVNKAQQLWFISSKGLSTLNLNTLIQKNGVMSIDNKLEGLVFVKDSLLLLSSNNIELKNLKKSISTTSYRNLSTNFYKSIIVHQHNPTFLVLSNAYEIIQFEINKNIIEQSSLAHNVHNDKINQIMWTECHKFVISAGTDKKIGIWEYK